MSTMVSVVEEACVSCGGGSSTTAAEGGPFMGPMTDNPAKGKVRPGEQLDGLGGRRFTHAR